jgi:hypothetical protein
LVESVGKKISQLSGGIFDGAGFEASFELADSFREDALVAGSGVLQSPFEGRNDEDRLIARGPLKGEIGFAPPLIEHFCEEFDFEVFDLAEFGLHGRRDDIELSLERAHGADHIAGFAELATSIEGEGEFTGGGNILAGDMIKVEGGGFLDMIEDGEAEVFLFGEMMMDGGLPNVELSGEIGIGKRIEAAFHDEFDGDLDDLGFPVGGHGEELTYQ